MLDRVTLDVMYPPPVRYSPKLPRYLVNMEEVNKLELVFDERIEDGPSCDPSELLDSTMLMVEDDIF